MANVVEFLKSFRRDGETSRTRKTKDPELTAILSMTAAEFSRQDLILLVRSHLFGEDIFLVSNEKCLSHLNGGVVAYLPEELKALYGKSPDLIKQAHYIKKIIDGEILKEGDPHYVKDITSEN